MNGLTDSLTIGIVLMLVFGSVCFYLYSRLVQSEKRVALMENILLDLKMSAEAGFMGHMQHSSEGEDNEVNHVEAVSSPSPLEQEDVDSSDEEFYKSVLEQATPSSSSSSSSSEVKELKEVKEVKEVKDLKEGKEVAGKLNTSYESMTVKELKAVVKQRGLTATSGAGRKELMDVLKKSEQGTVTESVPVGVDTSETFAAETLEN
jgi:hypothetical protein